MIVNFYGNFMTLKIWSKISRREKMDIVSFSILWYCVSAPLNVFLIKYIDRFVLSISWMSTELVA